MQTKGKGTQSGQKPNHHFIGTWQQLAMETKQKPQMDISFLPYTDNISFLMPTLSSGLFSAIERIPMQKISNTILSSNSCNNTTQQMVKTLQRRKQKLSRKTKAIASDAAKKNKKLDGLTHCLSY